MNNLTKALIGTITIAILAIAACVIAGITGEVPDVKIEYNEEADGSSAIITLGEEDVKNPESEFYGLGEVGEDIEVDGIPTVEAVDAGGPVVDAESSDDLSILDDGEEHGLGAYIYAPTESAAAFKNYTIGKCLNTDNAYGAQCWDLADVYWQNYAGRRAQTCGTGAAKGMTNDGCWQKNAGDDFVMIWDAKDLQAGDWLIFGNGQYGHVGMALGAYNNGYITLLGQNQGGDKCDGGGSSTNIVNISLKHFTGAFRPKAYIVQPEPAPKPEQKNDGYIVQKGDTLGAIIRKMGWYSGDKLFGDDGYAQKVAEANGIANRGLIYPGQVIYNI